MTKVEDTSLIKELREKSGNNLPNNLIKETDESIIAVLKDKKEQQAPSFLNKSLTAISDFFTGTKKTEYADLPEIGEYKGQGNLKLPLDLIITLDRKLQPELLQYNLQG